MERAHMHLEIEINYLLSGGMTYFFAGKFITLEAGRLALFWAGMPHRVTQVAQGTEFIWAMVPLAWVMQWELPGTLRKRLLEGEFVREPEVGLRQEAEDLGLLSRWTQDFRELTPECRRVAMIEVEARLCRLDLRLGANRAASKRSGAGGPVERATRFIGEHYADPIDVQEIARAAGTHPNYLMQLFHKTCGVNLWEYVLRLRVSHSQRLLLMSDYKIVDIAMESGFGSASRFYEVFRRYSGETPRRYRAERGRRE